MRAVKGRRGVLCVIVAAVVVLVGCDSDSRQEGGRSPLPSPKFPEGSYTCLAKKAAPAFSRRAGERVNVMPGEAAEADTYTWYYVSGEGKGDRHSGVVGPHPP